MAYACLGHSRAVVSYAMELSVMEWECPKHHDHLDGYVEDVRVFFFLVLADTAAASSDFDSLARE